MLPSCLIIVPGGTYFFTVVTERRIHLFKPDNYNPVKHNLVHRPHDWEWSTFHRWVRAGYYGIDGGAGWTHRHLPGNGGE